MAHEASAEPPYPQDGLQKPGELEAMLISQVDAIFPHESRIIRSYFAEAGSFAGIRVLDLGCGIGAFSNRVAWLLPGAEVTGMDLVPENIDLANKRAAELSKLEPPAGFVPPKFVCGSAFTLDESMIGAFDLVCVRSVLYAVQQPNDFVRAALSAAKKPGGRVHFLTEDYGAVWAHVGDGRDSEFDVERWWRDVPCTAFEKTGSCPRMSRTMHARVSEVLGYAPRLESPDLDEHTASAQSAPQSTPDGGGVEGHAVITLRPFAIHTGNTPRSTLGSILKSWRDGYSSWIAEHTGKSLQEEVLPGFERQIAATESSCGTWVWNVQVTTVRFGGSSQ